MTLIIIVLFFVYLIFVSLLIIGWHKSVAGHVLDDRIEAPLLSIIIPVRNEQAGIGHLLEDIRIQSYQNFEVIVVNDNSSDNTAAIVLTFTSQDPRFILLASRGEGKKVALTTGINASRGEIIVTTDGDCRIKVDWLKTVQKYFQAHGTKMVFGGVKLEGSSFFSTLQAHEFLSLIGTGAATLWYGFPSMCNGANLAFRKAIFFEVGGYTNNLHIPSGDDEFLMRKIFQCCPDGIKFISDSKAVVNTSASPGLKEFVHQRVRWAGKWKHNVSSWNAVLAIFIFCFQLSVLLLPIVIATGWIGVGLGVSLFFLKFLAEGFFLKKIALFVKVPWKWPAFIFLQIFYPIYAVWIGLISSFSTFEWKGRKT
ncbi:MAG TPA: glycosyltransferase [Chryseolinea sp.]|nr:glycosyltransferase [Chryseolinea sp.]